MESLFWTCPECKSNNSNGSDACPCGYTKAAPTPAKKPKMSQTLISSESTASSFETWFADSWAMQAQDMPQPVAEYRFHPKRRWRFDFAWPEYLVAVECEGGVWTKGRHTRGGGYIADCKKYNEATLMGWRVLRFADRDPAHIDMVMELLWEVID